MSRRAVRRTPLRRAVISVAALALAVGVVTAAAAVAGSFSHPTAPAPSPAPVTAAPASAGGLQRQFVHDVRSVSPKVVQIQTPIGLGSGIVFDARGDVVTNAHVVRGARAFVVTLADGDRRPATLVGADRRHDLAVVRLAGAHPAPAAFSTAPTPVGDLVLAIGNPLGLRSSVTQGIVSSVGRSVAEGGGVTLSPVIQTSAAINPGNSGGALVDLDGRVIGIPTLAALDPELGNGPAGGIGFAIPSATVVRVAHRLIAAAGL